MTARYLELFDKFCAVCVDKDVDKVMEIFADNAEIREPNVNLQGKKAIREFVEREAQKFEDYIMEKINVFEKDNQMAIEWRNTFKYEGKRVDTLGATVIHMENGKIRRMTEYVCAP
jgi:ketosteroid isomerase-like protein